MGPRQQEVEWGECSRKGKGKGGIIDGEGVENARWGGRSILSGEGERTARGGMGIRDGGK